MVILVATKQLLLLFLHHIIIIIANNDLKVYTRPLYCATIIQVQTCTKAKRRGTQVA
ncbi:MAG: hypothetical protein JWO55_279 [Candidatus Saccharibacteria bacterium]|jgi:hypothetical protein|nr:hypothetical protein [Candidatus Saccharibacteria bacterium]